VFVALRPESRLDVAVDPEGACLLGFLTVAGVVRGTADADRGLS
jgi:hypothetical protein